VKIYVTVAGVDALPADDITTTYNPAENSVELRVSALDPRIVEVIPLRRL
jgi:hypothetical protein